MFISKLRAYIINAFFFFILIASFFCVASWAHVYNSIAMLIPNAFHINLR